MKLRNFLLIATLLSGFISVSNVYANTDLSDLVAAEQANQRAAAQAKARAAAKAKAAAEAAAKKEERAYQEYQADKKRDQSYEDELRKLELEERKLELERRRARVSRENDFIDHELKRSAAHTDVIQSEADANRTLSDGANSLMKQVGEAEVKKNSGFFK